jgi:hypothetical protein
MEPRPDYVPRLWILWGPDRWMASDPRRVLAWFIVAPVLGLLGSVALLLAGSAALWVAGPWSVALILQAIVYVPRARRAMGERRRPD